MLNLKPLVGTHDIVLITLDTLRFDVAEQALQRGLTPAIAKRLPRGCWERRHTPASFTYAAHHAFFAGFLPTPAEPGKHPRLYASQFHGSETTTDETFLFEEPNLPAALRNRGYYTICVGGVGFFNKQTELGRVLPDLFDESHWSSELSVTHPDSTEHQVAQAIERVTSVGPRPVFLFINISALHQPNCMYLAGASQDSVETQIAALAYVDRWLQRLWDYLERRAAGVCLLLSDHGTAYGEDGFTGHRLAHPSVWDVPYAEFVYRVREAS
jgi:arylsulfatase A-like enzyme